MMFQQLVVKAIRTTRKALDSIDSGVGSERAQRLGKTYKSTVKDFRKLGKDI